MESFIYTFNVDKKICNGLINYHKKNKEYRVKGFSTNNDIREINKNIKDSVDVYFYNQSQNKIIQNYFIELSKGLNSYLDKYKISSFVNTEMINNIQYYPPNGGYKVWHCERNSLDTSKRFLAYMTYLNDVTEGGETEFYWQNISFKPKKGLSLIWPVDFTHMHRGITSKTQEKYIATGWYNLV